MIIGSYNVQQSQKRAEYFHFTLEPKFGPFDVSCTQESGTRLNLKSVISVPDTAVADGYSDDPCMVVTHSDERWAAIESIPLGSGLNGNRSALSITTREGIRVVNVHLTSGNVPRATAELATLVDVLGGTQPMAPFVIIGDFNHDPTAAYGGALCIEAGPPHSGMSILDWAMSTEPILECAALPNYKEAKDHTPFAIRL